jgi:hypothetical protein
MLDNGGRPNGGAGGDAVLIGSGADGGNGGIGGTDGPGGKAGLLFGTPGATGAV